VYVWQGYVTKNPGWSPIRELVTPVSAHTQNRFVTECSQTTPHWATLRICIDKILQVNIERFLFRCAHRRCNFFDLKCGYNIVRTMLIVIKNNCVGSSGNLLDYVSETLGSVLVLLLMKTVTRFMCYRIWKFKIILLYYSIIILFKLRSDHYIAYLHNHYYYYNINNCTFLLKARVLFVYKQGVLRKNKYTTHNVCFQYGNCFLLHYFVNKINYYEPEIKDRVHHLLHYKS